MKPVVYSNGISCELKIIIQIKIVEYFIQNVLRILVAIQKRRQLKSILQPTFQIMKYAKLLWYSKNFDNQAEQTGYQSSLPKLRPKKRKTPKYKKELQRLKMMSNYIKIMRFRARHEKKTYRVYCYDENSLCWPHRFTKKLNTMYADNDRDSDSQVIEHDKQKCLNSLFEAIQQRKKESAEKQKNE